MSIRTFTARRMLLVNKALQTKSFLAIWPSGCYSLEKSDASHWLYFDTYSYLAGGGCVAHLFVDILRSVYLRCTADNSFLFELVFYGFQPAGPAGCKLAQAQATLPARIRGVSVLYPTRSSVGAVFGSNPHPGQQKRANAATAGRNSCRYHNRGVYFYRRLKP